MADEKCRLRECHSVTKCHTGQNVALDKRHCRQKVKIENVALDKRHCRQTSQLTKRPIDVLY